MANSPPGIQTIPSGHGFAGQPLVEMLGALVLRLSVRSALTEFASAVAVASSAPREELARQHDLASVSAGVSADTIGSSDFFRLVAYKGPAVSWLSLLIAGESALGRS